MQRQPRPAPPPEEDILYQWRLARKMERAQEQVAKWGPAKGTLSLGSSRPQIAATGAKLDPLPLSGGVGILQPTATPRLSSEMDFAHPRPVLAPSVIPVAPDGTASLSARTQTTYTTPMAVTYGHEGIPTPMVPSQLGISRPQVLASGGPPSQSDGAISPQNQVLAPGLEPTPIVITRGTEIAGQIHPLLIEQEQFKSADVPSHMHLSCDILPCPHQRTLIEKGRSDQTVKFPLSSPVVESMLLDVTEKDKDQSQKPKEKITRESHDKAQFQEFPRKRNETEDKWHRKSAEPKDSEREELRRKELWKRKPKPKRESPQEPTASDLLSGVIGEVMAIILSMKPKKPF